MSTLSGCRQVWEYAILTPVYNQKHITVDHCAYNLKTTCVFTMLVLANKSCYHPWAKNNATEYMINSAFKKCIMSSFLKTSGLTAAQMSTGSECHHYINSYIPSALWVTVQAGCKASISQVTTVYTTKTTKPGKHVMPNFTVTSTPSLHIAPLGK